MRIASSSALRAILCVGLLVACGDPAGAPDAGADGDAGSSLPPHRELDLEAMVAPGSGLDIGDPHVLRVGDRWYLYATTSTLVLEAWVSDDLERWDSLGTVWEPTPGTWTELAEMWAPSVHPGDGGYYMYYVSFRRIGVAFADDPAGPFVDVLDHPLVGSGHGGVGDGVYASGGDRPSNVDDYDELAIDPFLLEMPDGRRFLYFVRYTPVSVLSVLEMDDYVTPLDATPTDVLEPGQRWEGVVCEGPWVELHGGHLALMYSGNFVRTDAYAIGAAMGTDPRGPFEKLADNPLLATDAAAGIHGPGHHGVTVDADGQPVLFFHSDVEAGGRRVFTMPMSFDDAGVPHLGR